MNLDILAIIEKDGYEYKKVASTNGGEYEGQCPFCGGVDRFRVQPRGNDGRGYYWCRHCNKSGDAIQYLRDKQNMSYREACEYLNVTPKSYKKRPGTRCRAIWTPKTYEPPPSEWQEKAAACVEYAKKKLWTDSGQRARQWLHDRGISDDTIRKSNLGLIPKKIYRKREDWGLETAINENTGEPRPIWIPRGIVIPCYAAGQLVRVRVRVPVLINNAKYFNLAGSRAAIPMVIGTDKNVYVVVESEFDGMMIAQEAGGLVTIVALGSVTTRPDMTTHEILKKSSLILVALDHDEKKEGKENAGGKESWMWWRNQYRQFKRWPVPVGKDPGEAYKAGLDIRAWIKVGMPKEKVPKKVSEKVEFDECPRGIDSQIQFQLGDNNSVAKPFFHGYSNEFDEENRIGPVS